MRLAIEIAVAVRAAIPDSMPLFARLSGDDWMGDSGWTVAQAAELGKRLAAVGVDLLDISSGGLHSSQKIVAGWGYQAPFSKTVKTAVAGKALVSAVGSITSAKQAQKLLDEDFADMVMVGRGFQKNPGLVW